MPRVTSLKKEYMIFDLPHFLVKEAKKKGMRQKDLAAAIKITPQAFCWRLKKDNNGKPRDSFSYGELLTLFNFLEMEDEEITKIMKL